MVKKVPLGTRYSARIFDLSMRGAVLEGAVCLAAVGSLKSLALVTGCIIRRLSKLMKSSL